MTIAMRRGMQRLRVAVASHDPETVGDLLRYFRSVGVSAAAAGSLRELFRHATSLQAVVLFPDGYEDEEVKTAMRHLRATRPTTLVLVVTGRADRFGEEASSTRPGPAPMILPKPIFGWALVDAIRAHLPKEGCRVRPSSSRRRGERPGAT